MATCSVPIVHQGTEQVAIEEHRNLLSPLMHVAVIWDVAAVGAHERQVLAIGTPPKAFMAIHLLLGNIFRQAVGHAIHRTAGQCSWLLCPIGRENVYLTVAHESHVRPIRAELWVVCSLTTQQWGQAFSTAS